MFPHNSLTEISHKNQTVRPIHFYTLFCAEKTKFERYFCCGLCQIRGQKVFSKKIVKMSGEKSIFGRNVSGGTSCLNFNSVSPVSIEINESGQLIRLLDMTPPRYFMNTSFKFEANFALDCTIVEL